MSRITVLVGAGASTEVSPELTTYHITNALLECAHYPADVAIPKEDAMRYYRTILDNLKKNGTPDPNFEHMFNNVLTQLSIIDSVGQEDLPESITIIPEDLPSTKRMDYAIYFANLTLLLIYEYIRHLSPDYRASNAEEWIGKLFEALSKSHYVDLFNLNYDQYLDDVLTDANDGFILSEHQEHSVGTGWVFDDAYSHDYQSKHLLNHLHGSIRFSRYYLPDEPNPRPLSKYDPPYFSWGECNPIELQDGRLSIYSPIVTGLDKLNSFMHEPYRCYHANFEFSMSQNKTLIIVGYGFKDFYINAAIDSFLFNPSKKILIIKRSRPPNKYNIEDKGEKLSSDPEGNIYWYRGTFKEFSIDENLNKILDVVL